MLEESDTIDFITLSEDGIPRLAITDSGMTADPARRLEAFTAKVLTYCAYMNSEEFQLKYTGWPYGTVVLMSPNAPGPEMAEMAAVNVKDVNTGQNFTIPIEYNKVPALFSETE